VVPGLVHLQTSGLSPWTLRLRVICCRESYQDEWTVRSGARGVVTSVHIREVGGSSPLAPTRSSPQSLRTARRGNRKDCSFRAELLILSPRTLRFQAVGSALARPEDIPRVSAHLCPCGWRVGLAVRSTIGCPDG